MATWGSLISYDEAAVTALWAPVRKGSRQALLEALQKSSPGVEWDAGTHEEVEGWSDDELTRCLFAEAAVPDASEQVCVGKYLDLKGLRVAIERLYGRPGPGEVLRELEQLDAVPGETPFDLVPIPREQLRKLWSALQVADPDLVAVSAKQALEAQGHHGGSSAEFTRVALGFIGWTLEHTPYALAFIYEGFPELPRPAPGPAGSPILKDELLQANLPVWDFTQDEAPHALTWCTQLDESTRRVHAFASPAGTVSHVLWEVPSRWQRLLGRTEWRSLGGSEGACPAADCLPCRAAVLAARRMASGTKQ